VSKFLLNLLIKILKVLPNSEIYLKLKNKSLFIPSLYQLSWPLLAFWPTRPHRPPSSFFTALPHSFLGCCLPLLTRLARACPWRISGNTLSLSEGACHGTRRPSSSSSRIEPERASCCWQPASCRPHGRPRPPPVKRKRRRVASSFIPPLNGAPSTLKYSGNWRLQAEALTPAITHLHHPGALPRPYKRTPTPTEHSHTIGLSPPTLYCAHTIALLSRSSTAVTPPPHCHLSSGEQFPGCAASPCLCGHRHSKPPWPRAAARLSSSEPPPRPCLRSTMDRDRAWSMAHGSFAKKPLGFSKINPQSMIS
jgi:hypothetical protein